MNAYDFDGTIYDGDATVDFFLHCLRRFPGVRRHCLSLLGPGARFLAGRLDKTAWKQTFFGFLAHVPEVDLEVRLFWDRSGDRIKPFYLGQKRPDDLIISASPAFLLEPMLRRVGVRGLIASRVDARTGRFDGPNCHGEEKLRRFRAERPGEEIDAFYSDSKSDAPLARVAARAYWVRGARITDWRP